MTTTTSTIPRAYVWKRIHSLFGLWIAIFLIEHLITNSQAALFFGDSGMGFIRAVNFLKSLPYLHVLEVALIGIPILVHGAVGIKYIFTAKMNASKGDGSRPGLKYSRNKAYSMQRISSWILLVGLILHVGFMRFYLYPVDVKEGSHSTYMVRVTMDGGLYTVADRLGVKLYNAEMIDEAKVQLEAKQAKMEETLQEAEEIEGQGSDSFNQKNAEILKSAQGFSFQQEYVRGLEKRAIASDQVIAASPNFGSATLLTVRDAFKNPLVGLLYTIFVLAAVFHGFNGLWTFCISWGIIVKMRSQSRAVNVCVGIMALLGLLGLASIWGTYWINLRN